MVETVSSAYMAGRKQYKRPQAMIWADQVPTIDANGKLIPVGFEVGSDPTGIAAADLDNQFLIVSDHNRGDLSLNIQRIEQKRRMANGTMRSYHIADKLALSVSWTLIPSRGFKVYPNFDQETGKPVVLQPGDLGDWDGQNFDPETTYFANKSEKYTVDGGAGGGEMLDWYENHTGPFWVMLSYDKYNNFGTDNEDRLRLSEYSQSVKMYISSFDYTVVKRGGDNFDLWNVSVTLEEV